MSDVQLMKFKSVLIQSSIQSRN